MTFIDRVHFLGLGRFKGVFSRLRFAKRIPFEKDCLENNNPQLAGFYSKNISCKLISIPA